MGSGCKASYCCSRPHCVDTERWPGWVRGFGWPHGCAATVQGNTTGLFRSIPLSLSLSLSPSLPLCLSVSLSLSLIPSLSQDGNILKPAATALRIERFYLKAPVGGAEIWAAPTGPAGSAHSDLDSRANSMVLLSGDGSEADQDLWWWSILATNVDATSPRWGPLSVCVCVCVCVCAEREPFALTWRPLRSPARARDRPRRADSPLAASRPSPLCHHDLSAW